MRAAAGWRDSSSASAAAVALRALLIATACGLVFALLNLPDGGRAGTPAPGEWGARRGWGRWVLRFFFCFDTPVPSRFAFWDLNLVEFFFFLSFRCCRDLSERPGGSALSPKRAVKFSSYCFLQIDGQSDEIAAEEDERISKSPPDTKEKIWMMQDQLIMAKAYLHFASPQGSAHLVRELKLRIKEIERAISHSSGGSRVAGSALQKMKAMELTLSKAQRAYPRCSQMTSKLRAMTYNSEELVRAHQSESSFLEEVAVRTLPKGHHCLAMRLTTEYFSLDPKEREFPKVDSKQMDGYHHYAIFSDNVLASAVVVNSTIATSKKDLSGLWDIHMKDKVMGAVEKCTFRESYHRLDSLVDFLNPTIFNKFDAKACIFAFGMNIFDLNEWRKQDLTATYHKWFQVGKRQRLWKAGSLPLGQLVFYNQTLPLDRRWHVLGLGHDSSIGRYDLESASVIHYSGKLKPWLEISIPKYRDYWNRYLNYDNTFLQQCNIHG
ncbi:hypothetical protein HU200_034473 [Digitaria exilis]|uniref:Hexosyltransferase n=1 Tax=Digitaria exilis TaxID=1010633 RepID=A0A835BGL8_9POAL|nr:hypothetical protein HU200_034473 [Digitaria exilis]